ncbi:RNA polymerase sigma factor [Niallia sp. 03133]|uniref:RNA polymerase sigma factor n=1 Tax=Niallia sp. 03133 TaxID=3458060 RepID=UPI004044FA1F
MSDPRLELYMKYKNEVYLYLYRTTSNKQIAEDLTQDTFLRAFQSLSRFRGDASMKTWLLRIARNTYINFSKKKQNLLEIQTETIEEWGVPQDQYHRLHEQHLIKLVLVKLPENYRTYIILRDGNGLTYQEISLVTNETIPQVKVGLYRARKRFRELYKQEVGEEEWN